MADVLLWLSRVLVGHDQAQQAKVLNLSPTVAFAPARLDSYLEARKSLLQERKIPLSPDEIPTELNITPAMSDVPVHHDEELVISTARALKSRMRLVSERAIVKLWVVWPSNHMHTLSQHSPRSSYGDTAHSLSNAGGAVWFTQRDGETIVLPGNLAHYTFTIQSCYLLSSSCPGISLARVPLVSSDIAAGTTEVYAVARLIDAVEAALQRTFDESHRFMRDFWGESAHNIPILRRNKKTYDRFINLLANHLRKEKRCISCEALSIVPDCREMADYKQHVQSHTENGILTFRYAKSKRKLRPLRGLE